MDHLGFQCLVTNPNNDLIQDIEVSNGTVILICNTSLRYNLTRQSILLRVRTPGQWCQVMSSADIFRPCRDPRFRQVGSNRRWWMPPATVNGMLHLQSFTMEPSVNLCHCKHGRFKLDDLHQQFSTGSSCQAPFPQTHIPSVSWMVIPPLIGILIMGSPHIFPFNFSKWHRNGAWQ